MNYLGHALLSFGHKDILMGNMIGDHVKGKIALAQYPPDIARGVELHRLIDQKTDIHPATGRAKLLFRADYGLYSGAIMDTLYDHFLANDPKYFADANALMGFATDTYRQIEENSAYFPPKFAAYFPYMKEQNWLFGYRSLKGMERSLNGLARRAQHMPPIAKAYEIFVANYYHINQCYYELIDDMVKFVKTELNN